MGDLDLLEAELAGLQRGRGLRRGDLRALVGPALSDALNLEPGASAVQARDRVVAALKSAAEELASDRRLVFMHACGLTSPETTLGARLAAAGIDLDRDVRTLRRWLKDANVGVATTLERGRRRRRANEEGRESRDDWYIDSMRATTDLREVRPVLTATKTICPTVGGITHVVEKFGLPPSQEAIDPQVRVRDGGRMLDLQREGSTVWALTVQLDHQLAVGELHPYTVEVTLPARRVMVPHTVMIPIRPCREFVATVHFGAPPAASAAWVLDGVIPTWLLDDHPTGTPIDLTSSATTRHRFAGLTPGLAYGVRWTWI